MTRGVRGATTVDQNEAKFMIEQTRRLIEEMVTSNKIAPQDVSHVFISVTPDLNATFPAKALRELSGYTYVPVMCMSEIDVPDGLPRCIRVMMVVNTQTDQSQITHIFHNEAIKLRPDLTAKGGS